MSDEDSERTCSKSSELFMNHLFSSIWMFHTWLFWISHQLFIPCPCRQTHPSNRYLTERRRCGPEVRFTRHVWQTQAERSPPGPCKVQTRQCKFKSCPSVCLNPPPLILGQFTRWNYPKWTVGGPCREEELLFSTVIGARVEWEGERWRSDVVTGGLLLQGGSWY